MPLLRCGPSELPFAALAIVATIPLALMTWLGVSATEATGMWLDQRAEISNQEARITKYPHFWYSLEKPHAREASLCSPEVWI